MILRNSNVLLKSANVEGCMTANNTVNTQTTLDNRLDSINAYNAYTNTESVLDEYPNSPTASITITGIIRGSIGGISISNAKLLSLNALLCQITIPSASVGVANVQLTVNDIVKYVKCSTVGSPIGNLYGGANRPLDRNCLFMDNKLVFSRISASTTFDIILYF
jgi:hypothetical protein